MTEEYYIGEIFIGEYPPEASFWCDEHNAYMVEIEPLDNQRRFQIQLIPEETPEERRQRLDNRTLTPSDVERALLKAKGWDFENLKVFLKAQGFTDMQIKAVGIELRANKFYRGATMGEEPNKIRIVDTVGMLLGYNSDDMDYLFEHKELPNKEV